MVDLTPIPATFSIRELLRPEAFPHVVEGLTVVETHLSWVVLTGRYAYKIKKPVRLDFIDASSLEKRRALCEEELRLNRRLAPELYLGVVPIGYGAAGVQVGTASGLREYAVQMLEFDREQELSGLLVRREVSDSEIVELARRIAQLHTEAAVAPDDACFGSYAQVCETLLANVAAISAPMSERHRARALDRLADWTRTELERLRPAIEFRRANGAIRECHGDLHSRNVVRWQHRLVPFDCLEFDPALRWIDVASEVAFLYMDLLAHERIDLANVFLSKYLEVTGDYEALRLLRFYAVHRALVRAKVDGIQSADRSPGLTADLSARWRSRIDLALRLTQEDMDPTLMIMSGVSGSGKSWLSEKLVVALGVLRIRSDLERKRLAGLAPEQRTRVKVSQGLYDAQRTDRTYARLLECAEHALIGGCSVVVDASFLNAAQRELFRGLANRLRRRFLIVACRAEPRALRERVRAREAAGRDPSDATAAVLEHQLATYHAPDANESRDLLTVDTTAMHEPAAAIELIRARLRADSSA